MIYAPIIIPTLCRFEQLKNCIESLQQNSYAENTELFIGLDYPSKDSHQEGYQKILSYLESGISGFANITIIKHSYNIGWYQNYTELRKAAYLKYDRLIYTEDDNVFSPNFLEFINKNLEQYQDDDSILAVSGYSYPLTWDSLEDSLIKINTYFSAWGYGIWKSKEEEMLRHISLNNFDDMMRDFSFMHKLCKASPNQYCNFVKGMCEYTNMLIQNEKIMTIDLSFGLYMFYYDKHMIFPTVSKSRNMGHDVGGLNCKEMSFDCNGAITHRNYLYAEQPVDINIKYNLSTTPLSSNTNLINRKLDLFFNVEPFELFRCKCAWLMYRLLGKSITTKLIKKYTSSQNN